MAHIRLGQRAGHWAALVAALQAVLVAAAGKHPTEGVHNLFKTQVWCAKAKARKEAAALSILISVQRWWRRELALRWKQAKAVVDQNAILDMLVKEVEEAQKEVDEAQKAVDLEEAKNVAAMAKAASEAEFSLDGYKRAARHDVSQRAVSDLAIFSLKQTRRERHKIKSQYTQQAVQEPSMQQAFEAADVRTDMSEQLQSLIDAKQRVKAERKPLSSKGRIDLCERVEAAAAQRRIACMQPIFCAVLRLNIAETVRRLRREQRDQVEREAEQRMEQLIIDTTERERRELECMELLAAHVQAELAMEGEAETSSCADSSECDTGGVELCALCCDASASAEEAARLPTEAPPPDAPPGPPEASDKEGPISVRGLRKRQCRATLVLMTTTLTLKRRTTRAPADPWWAERAGARTARGGEPERSSPCRPHVARRQLCCRRWRRELIRSRATPNIATQRR